MNKSEMRDLMITSELAEPYPSNVVCKEARRNFANDVCVTCRCNHLTRYILRCFWRYYRATLNQLLFYVLAGEQGKSPCCRFILLLYRRLSKATQREKVPLDVLITRLFTLKLENSRKLIQSVPTNRLFMRLTLSNCLTWLNSMRRDYVDLATCLTYL